MEHIQDVLVDLEMSGAVVVWDSPGGLLIACIGDNEADELASNFYQDPDRLDRYPDERPRWAQITNEPTWPYLIVGSTTPGYAAKNGVDACGGRPLRECEYCLCCDRWDNK